MKPKRINRNKKPQIKPRDQYTVSNDAVIADVDGDGAVDLTLTHMTKRNGEAFVEMQTVWYGIDPVLAEAFAAPYKPLLGKDLPVASFGQLVQHYRTLAQGTAKILDAGKFIAEGIGETAD